MEISTLVAVWLNAVQETLHEDIVYCWSNRCCRGSADFRWKSVWPWSFVRFLFQTQIFNFSQSGELFQVIDSQTRSELNFFAVALNAVQTMSSRCGGGAHFKLFKVLPKMVSHIVILLGSSSTMFRQHMFDPPP